MMKRKEERKVHGFVHARSRGRNDDSLLPWYVSAVAS
jgi:hypothetical protein